MVKKTFMKKKGQRKECKLETGWGEPRKKLRKDKKDQHFFFQVYIRGALPKQQSIALPV